MTKTKTVTSQIVTDTQGKRVVATRDAIKAAVVTAGGAGAGGGMATACVDWFVGCLDS